MTNDYTLTQKAIAEFIGTFSIIFFGAGAVAIDLMTVPAGIIEATGPRSSRSPASDTARSAGSASPWRCRYTCSVTCRASTSTPR